MEKPRIPNKGRASSELEEELILRSEGDVDYKKGKTWSLVYWAGEAHHDICERAQRLYMDTNALNPMAFKSLKRMEYEVIQMTAQMLNGPDTAVGTMTSGGTESLLLAVKTYRDMARKKKPWILRPNIVVPESIHVGFDKACHYFGVKKKTVPMLEDGRVDVRAMSRTIDRNTIMIGASAPQYPWGTIDPIEEIGQLAEKKKLPLHVDACFGGFMLPWLEKNGVPMPLWDFRVKGVTSVSADVHKYGYAPKGSSVIVYRSMQYLRHQFFVEGGWTGGVYISPSLLGTRSGGSIASAWASMMSLGEEGYRALAKDAWKASELLREGILKIDGLKLLGRRDATIVTWAASDERVDIFAVADEMAALGWSVDRQQHPASIHLTVNANNLKIVPDYLKDLKASVEKVMANPHLAKEGEAAIYGLMAKVPISGLVDREVLKVMERMYGPDGDSNHDTLEAPEGFINELIEKYGDQIFSALEQLKGLKNKLIR